MARESSNTSGTDETPFLDNATQRYCFIALMNISCVLKTGPAFCSTERRSWRDTILERNSWDLEKKINIKELLYLWINTYVLLPLHEKTTAILSHFKWEKKHKPANDVGQQLQSSFRNFPGILTTWTRIIDTCNSILFKRIPLLTLLPSKKWNSSQIPQGHFTRPLQLIRLTNQSHREKNPSSITFLILWSKFKS